MDIASNPAGNKKVLGQTKLNLNKFLCGND